LEEYNNMAQQPVRLIAVCGPTATGKTELAVHLARTLQGEIVSCDSMQIYRGFDIGTAKPDEDEQKAARHHLIGVVDPETDFSVSDYVGLAEKTILEITGRGKLPVLAGGTGLYMRSLLRGVRFEEHTRDDSVRQRLFKETAEYGNERLYERLRQCDPAAADAIHPGNLKRVVRALEYREVTGRLFSHQMKKRGEAAVRYDGPVFCLLYRDRRKLYDRINLRVDKMLQKGLLTEARQLYELLRGRDHYPTVAQAIGYKELFPYFDGVISLEDAVTNIKRKTRNYAKRQITWFRKEENLQNIYIDDYSDFDGVLRTCLATLAKKGIE